MPEVATDELVRADDAFASNHLLSTFSSEDRGLIEPYGTVIQVSTGELVLKRGDCVALGRTSAPEGADLTEAHGCRSARWVMGRGFVDEP